MTEKLLTGTLSLNTNKIFRFCKLFTLGFYFSLAVLVTNSDSQISEVIALNPSFMFSSKINVRDSILKEFSFVYVYGVSMSGKQGKGA